LIAAKYLDKNAATLAASGWSAASGPTATAFASVDDADGVGDGGAGVANPDGGGLDDADEFSTGANAAVCAGEGLRCGRLATARPAAGAWS
jgi:hypothetical protein